MESPESSVATFKPFEMVVTLVSGTLYNDCNKIMKCKILTGKNIRRVKRFPTGTAFTEGWQNSVKVSYNYFVLIPKIDINYILLIKYILR